MSKTNPSMAEAAAVVRDGLATLRARRDRAAPGSEAAKQLSATIAKLETAEADLARRALVRHDAHALDTWTPAERARLRISERDKTDAGSTVSLAQIRGLREPR